MSSLSDDIRVGRSSFPVEADIFKLDFPADGQSSERSAFCLDSQLKGVGVGAIQQMPRALADGCPRKLSRGEVLFYNDV